MSRFLSTKYRKLVPYTPGEQPKDRKFIKLNTNESPFPPSKNAVAAAAKAAESLMLYSDPESRLLTQKLADTMSVDYDEVLVTNGSDEILNFAFMAFCDSTHPAVFPDITYGFYPVFADLNGVPYSEIPLADDFSVNVSDYLEVGKTIFLANPNAPTGIALSLEDVENIVKSNPESVVVIDEAYVDFGAESAIPLIKKYDNLLVTGTFSKSRSLAGGRLGFGIGCKELIRDLITIKFSTNPYNVNSMTAAAGYVMLCDADYTSKCCKTIIENREFTKKELSSLGFTMTDSSANFVFVRHPSLDGEIYYQKLREKGILVRHFSKEKIAQYNRITIGTRAEMEALIAATKEILEELR